MTKQPDLRDLLGDDASAEELERLRRAHELLLQAGPPPELPPALAGVPAPAELPQQEELGWLPPRRIGRVLTAAAAFAALALAIGYVVGKRGGFETEFSRAMHGTQAAPRAQAVIKVARIDEAGNWPLELVVRGLRPLPRGGYYELWLTKGERATASCGTFRVQSGKTTVRLNAPYNFKSYDGWIVVSKLPGRSETRKPLLTS